MNKGDASAAQQADSKTRKHENQMWWDKKARQWMCVCVRRGWRATHHVDKMEATLVSH